jgi:hypothetical protein
MTAIAKRVKFKNGKFGLRAVPTTAWTDRMGEYLKSRGIVELELNAGWGWRGADLGFLAEFPKLKALEIVTLGFGPIEPIHCLHNLRHLNVTTYCKSEIRFLEFPLLESCVLEWRAKAKSVFACATLKDLFINRYQGKDSSVFQSLPGLTRLGVLNSPLPDVRGLGKLRWLQHLRLNCLTRLTSLDGLDELADLRELDLRVCRKISSVEKLGSLSRLDKLVLSDNGDIASIKCLAALQRLEVFVFEGDTNVRDGDLSVLKQMRALKGVSFKNRRHYSQRWQDFDQSYWQEFARQHMKTDEFLDE